MLKKTLIGLVLLVSAFLLWHFLYEAYDHTMMYIRYLTQRPVAIGIEAGPIKVNISEATEWSSVAKALVTLLGTYLGIKVINKYIK